MNIPFPGAIDLQSEHERYITEKVFGKPVFVTGYPKEIKAFYMRLNDDGKTVAAMDLLAPGVGEIIGGSQREERYDVLGAAHCWSWACSRRITGGIWSCGNTAVSTHAGYGLGFERMIMYLTGMSNIRDVLPFPRVPKWAEF